MRDTEKMLATSSDAEARTEPEAADSLPGEGSLFEGWKALAGPAGWGGARRRAPPWEFRIEPQVSPDLTVERPEGHL